MENPKKMATKGSTLWMPAAGLAVLASLVLAFTLDQTRYDLKTKVAIARDDASQIENLLEHMKTQRAADETRINELTSSITALRVENDQLKKNVQEVNRAMDRKDQHLADLTRDLADLNTAKSNLTQTNLVLGNELGKAKCENTNLAGTIMWLQANLSATQCELADLKCRTESLQSDSDALGPQQPRQDDEK
jgi:chromosome segregation ATPase